MNHRTEEWLLEYMVNMKTPRPQGSTSKEVVISSNSLLPEDKADEGRESKLQTKIMNWANDKGYPLFHDYSWKRNKAGWPDVTLCLPKAITLYCELKSAKGVMKEEQAKIRQQMVFLGHHHFIVKSYKQFLTIVNTIIEKGE